jgi:hypothetical protein
LESGLLRCRLDGPKYGSVSPFGNLDHNAGVSAFTVEILVQFETELSDMDANRAIFRGAVTCWLAKHDAADPMLRQILDVTVNGTLSQKAQ